MLRNSIKFEHGGEIRKLITFLYLLYGGLNGRRRIMRSAITWLLDVHIGWGVN